MDYRNLLIACDHSQEAEIVNLSHYQERASEAGFCKFIKTPLNYSASYLRALRERVYHQSDLNNLPNLVMETIKLLHIHKRRKRGKRGRMAGLRSRATSIKARKSDPVNLINIKSNESNSESTPIPSVKYVIYNTRSAIAKPLAINEFITDNELDVLSMCETWIQSGDDAKVREMCPSNFSFYGKSRNSRGGGVGLIARDNIHVKQFDCGHFNSFEYHCAVLHLAARKLKLVTLYRPPNTSNSNITEFLNEFETFLSDVTMFAGPVLIAGDFNVHFNKPDHSDVRQLIDILDSFGLHQHVQQPTHKYGNILDLVITRSDSDIVRSSSVQPRLEFISDHHPISCILNCATPSVAERTTTKRLLRNFDAETFADILTNKLNSSLEANYHTTAEWLEDNFRSCAKDTLDALAPQVERTIRNSKLHPWYSDKIHSQRQLRRRLERKWHKTRTTSDWEAYITQYQLVVEAIELAKKEYYRGKLLESPQEAFKVVNSLLHTSSSQLPSGIPDMVLADMFVNFFTEKVAKIRSTLDNCATAEHCDLIPLHECPHKLTSFSPVEQTNLHRLIMNAKTTSCMSDPVPTHILKDSTVLTALLPYLTSMVNRSLVSGVMPDGLKSALVLPHLKKQNLDPDILSNFRPVSNLQFMGKIIEKCVSHQLGQHMSLYNLGDELQSAYKVAHSTETALVKVKRDCDNALDSGKSVILVLLDLSAAFDTIDHRILLDRLRSYVGVEGSAYEWLKSYVSGRSQKVLINNSVSKSLPLDVGVPQGSVLGPLLFLIYILPLRHLIAKYGVSYHGFADDTQLYLEFDPKTTDGLTTAITKLEKCITEIKQWMVFNKLKLNDDKTEAVIIASPHFHLKIMDSNPVINIGNASIHFGKTVKNLGVMMDCNLNMTHQMKAVTKSMYYHMRGIRHVRHYLDDDTCKKAVVALVTSRLDYANALLAGVSESGLRRLQVAQNCAARLITGTPRMAHITPVLYELHWLPVHLRIIFKCMCMVYKCLNDPNMPAYLSCLLTRYSPSRNLRSSASGTQLSIQRPRTKYGDRRFETFVSLTWNTLPQHIQLAPSLDVFKKNLKTLLFSNYFIDH